MGTSTLVWGVRHRCGCWVEYRAPPHTTAPVSQRHAERCPRCRNQGKPAAGVSAISPAATSHMPIVGGRGGAVPVQNVLIVHRCGCQRTYELRDMAPHVAQQTVAQLKANRCGRAECPKSAQRLLGRNATPAVNGRGER